MTASVGMTITSFASAMVMRTFAEAPMTDITVRVIDVNLGSDHGVALSVWKGDPVNGCQRPLVGTFSHSDNSSGPCFDFCIVIGRDFNLYPDVVGAGNRKQRSALGGGSGLCCLCRGYDTVDVGFHSFSSFLEQFFRCERCKFLPGCR